MVEIVVCARLTRHEILEGMLAETPLVLDKKLVLGAGGETTRPLVIDGGLN